MRIVCDKNFGGPALMLVLAVVLGGCERSASGEAPPPPPGPQFERQAMVRFHMQWHFDDLRAVERLLIDGKLKEATTRAFLLTKPAPDPGMAPWHREVQHVTDAALKLTHATNTDAACRQLAQVAKACADCHVQTHKLPVFSTPPALPPDEPTQAARMARHQWAADRLWEGVVGASDRSWRAGLDVIAATPVPFSPITEGPGLASYLQELARNALATRATDTLDDRAIKYGEMLVTCAACHSGLKAKPSSQPPSAAGAQ